MNKPAPLPGWLMRLLIKPKFEPAPVQGPPRELSAVELADGGTKWALAALKGLISETELAPEGQRNATLYSSCRRLGSLVAAGLILDGPGALTSLEGAARRAGLKEVETKKTAANGYKTGLENPARAPKRTEAGRSGLSRRNSKILHPARQTDGSAALAEPELIAIPETVSEDFIAQVLVSMHGNDIVYDSTRKMAFFWESRWVADRTNRLLDLSRQHCRCFNPRGKVSLGKHSTAAGVMKLVAADQRIAVIPEIFDKDDLLLGCPSGVIELESGLFRPGRREDYITMTAGTDPAENEYCAEFLKWLAWFTKDNNELIAFLKRLIGYLLSGLICEHIFIIVYGPGGGGKSTLLDIIRALLGDYADVGNLELFFESEKSSERNYALADANGKRVITAFETKMGQTLDTAKVKSLTGEETIRARQIYEKSFQLRRKFTPILGTNHLPRIKAMDSGIERRLILIPADNQLSKDKIDVGLKDRLLTELPGIMRWAINGFLEYRREGLNPPLIVQSRTREYIYNEDMLSQWLDTDCTIGPDYKAGTTTLRESWNAFQANQGITEEYLTRAKGFAAMMTAKGFRIKHEKKGNVFEGLTLTLKDEGF